MARNSAPTNSRSQILGLSRKRTACRHDADGVLLEIEADSNTLIISCSGIVPNRIVYAMENTSSSVETNKLFLCDKSSLWYYKGIEGISTSFDDTIDFVGDFVAGFKDCRIFAIGTSGGGYMALALAGALKLNRALALSPQTTLSHSGRAELSDDRWQSEMDCINAVRAPYDIKQFLAAGDCQSHIVYPAGELLDKAHALRLASVSNVRLHEFASDDHNVASALHTRRLLRPVIDTFISEPASSLAVALEAILNRSDG